MSAPDTHIEKQERQHAPSLVGIKGAVIGAVIILVGVWAYAIVAPNDDETSTFERPAVVTQEGPVVTE
ncbi:MAG: hypothetical protein WBB25_20875 [Sulfitobacter sp.]